MGLQGIFGCIYWRILVRFWELKCLFHIPQMPLLILFYAACHRVAGGRIICNNLMYSAGEGEFRDAWNIYKATCMRNFRMLRGRLPNIGSPYADFLSVVTPPAAGGEDDTRQAMHLEGRCFWDACIIYMAVCMRNFRMLRGRLPNIGSP